MTPARFPTPPAGFPWPRRHRQYTGRLIDSDTVKFILQGRGKGGKCLDYLRNTIRHLDELGIPDGPLHRLVKLAEDAAGKS